MSERFILRARVIRCMVYDRFFRLAFGDSCDLVLKVTKPLLLWEHESCLKRPPPPPPPPPQKKKKLRIAIRNKTVKQNRVRGRKRVLCQTAWLCKGGDRCLV